MGFIKRNLVIWAALCAALLPWAAIRIQQATNSDMLWLADAAARVMGGGTMADVAYENNPPLALFAYALPVILDRAGTIPLHYGLFLQTLAMVGVAAAAIAMILRRWAAMPDTAVAAFTAGFVLMNTVGSSLYFGERDHLIAIALVPFVLAQIGLTMHRPACRVLNACVFIGGAVLILLKPHYGLLPTLILLHRMVTQRRLSVVFDPDFMALAVAVLSYAAIVITAFPDYARIIMPDVVALYLPNAAIDLILMPAMTVTGICGVLALVAWRMAAMDGERRALSLLMLFCAVISLVPYVVQGMGFYYHLIPALVFIACAVGLILPSWIATQSRGETFPALAGVAMMTALVYVFAPLNMEYPRHRDYASFPLSRMIAECRRPDGSACRFFMFNRNMGVIHETAHYTGAYHASRFPSLWFMPEMILHPDKGEKFFTKYAGMVAEDIERDKPDLAFVWRSEDSFIKTGFVEYFRTDPQFATAWAAYEKTGEITIDYADYYRGTRVSLDPLVFDVYRRKTSRRLPQ